MVEPTTLTISILTLVSVVITGFVTVFKKSSCMTSCISCKTGGGDDDIVLERVNADDSTTTIKIPHVS